MSVSRVFPIQFTNAAPDMVASAALNIANSTYDTYFFKGDQYATVHWTPGQGYSDTLLYGPAKFADDAPAFKSTGFSYIDAVLPIPNTPRAYVFSGLKYAKAGLTSVSSTPGKLPNITLSAAFPITDQWASLKAAGFGSVDAAMIVPNSTTQAFFFKGDKYIRVNFTENQSGDQLLEGPTSIVTGWNAMGFNSVDIILPRPGGPVQNAYVFSGPNYIQTEVTKFGEGSLISEPRDVATWWKGSLGKAGFY